MVCIKSKTGLVRCSATLFVPAKIPNGNPINTTKTSAATTSASVLTNDSHKSIFTMRSSPSTLKSAVRQPLSQKASAANVTMRTLK